MSDGWGWGPMPVQLPAGANPSSVSDGVHRNVLTAAVDNTLTAVQMVTMSPSGYATLSVPPPGYGQTMGKATGFLGVPMLAYPITLLAPDPFGRPELGDGKNQFVYDATTPAGQLTLPITVSVFGSKAADTAWLMRGDYRGQHVNVKYDLPQKTQFTGDNWFVDQTLCSVVPADQIMAKNGDLSNNPGNGYLFAGLPKSNSEFAGTPAQQGGTPPGYHQVTLQVNTGDGINHPSELAHF